MNPSVVLAVLTESLAALIGLISFVWVFDEYWHRRGWRLNLTASAGLAGTLAMLALLTGQSLLSYGFPLVAAIFWRFAIVSLAVQAWWMAAAVAATFVRRFDRRHVATIVAVPALISLLLLVLGRDFAILDQHGWIYRGELAYRWLAFSQLALVIVSFVAAHHFGRADRLIMRLVSWAPAVGLAAFAAFTYFGWRQSYGADLLASAVAIWTGFVQILTISLAAHGHPDHRVTHQPMHLLCGNLKLKLTLALATASFFPAFVVLAVALNVGLDIGAFIALDAAVVSLAGFLSAATYLAAADAVRPLRQLQSAVENATISSSPLAQPRRSDEIGDLVRAVVTKSKDIAARLRGSQPSLIERERFLLNTAHEMRNPLSVFSWTVDMLRFGDTGPLNKQQLELIEVLHQTTRRLNDFVSNLLDASKVHNGWLKLVPAPVQIEDVIDEIAGAFAVKFREKGITLVWQRSRPPLPPVWGDRDRLYQILLNLVSNAFKYTPAGGRITIAVEQSDEVMPGGTQGAFVRVSVSDTGKGVPQDQQAMLGTRFFRARNVQPDEAEGTGLGLYITRKLVNLHDGALWFDSQEAKGSVFYFTIPVSDGQDRKKAAPR